MTGAGGETRTPNIQIRSLTLYPVELRPQAEIKVGNFENLSAEKTGASEGVRTLGHWNHNQELYQLSYARHYGFKFLPMGFKWFCEISAA